MQPWCPRSWALTRGPRPSLLAMAGLAPGRGREGGREGGRGMCCIETLDLVYFEWRGVGRREGGREGGREGCKEVEGSKPDVGGGREGGRDLPAMRSRRVACVWP